MAHGDTFFKNLHKVVAQDIGFVVGLHSGMVLGLVMVFLLGFVSPNFSRHSFISGYLDAFRALERERQSDAPCFGYQLCVLYLRLGFVLFRHIVHHPKLSRFEAGLRAKRERGRAVGMMHHRSVTNGRT